VNSSNLRDDAPTHDQIAPKGAAKLFDHEEMIGESFQASLTIRKDWRKLSELVVNSGQFASITAERCG
jgi:hypothetical protein